MDEAKKTYKCSEVGETCKYRGYISTIINNKRCMFCDYLGMTDERRGCPIEECDKYEPGTVEDKKEKFRKSIRKTGRYIY